MALLLKSAFDGVRIDEASILPRGLEDDDGQGQSSADTQFDSFIGRGVRFCD